MLLRRALPFASVPYCIPPTESAPEPTIPGVGRPPSSETGCCAKVASAVGGSLHVPRDISGRPLAGSVHQVMLRDRFCDQPKMVPPRFVRSGMA